MKSNTTRFSRRFFIKSSTALAAASGLPAWFAEATRSQAAEPPSKSPNERPGIGLVGCGGMGKGDCNAARHYGEVVAVCDVDDKQAAQAVKDFTKDGKAPAKYNDFRKMLERPDVEVVITGTPDHWHTLVNLAAVHAGKDVYTEKPLTLTIDEGKRLVRAVKATRRVLQVGSQQRSERGFRLACELVRNGRIGKLQHMIVGLPTGPREGPFPAQPVPEGMDWDFYVGQAPFFEFNGRNHHWNFRWWWRFSGGQMTDWGAHHNDIAQWGNGTERSGPVEVDGKSLIDMIPGGYDAAAKYRVDFKYANGVTLTIVDDSTGTDRNVVGDKKRTPNGIQFLGTAGWIFVTRGRIQASVPELLEDPLAPMGDRLYRSDNHMGNFFESVKSRKPPICDAEIGHRSITVAHLGVISVRLGRPLKWNPDREEFVDDKEANQWLAREMRRPYDYSFIGLQG